MDLRFSDAEIAFRDEVRTFLRTKFPADIKHKQDHRIPLTKDDQVRWQKILYEQGWVAPNWPEEYGGPGWTATQRFIFTEELSRANAPAVVPFGLNMVGPVIYNFGNEAQKERFLPDILQSNVWWCQGYSEPGAGSDLAGLKTTAVRDGDHYVVNGQKTWTSTAHNADWIFCLVRTDPKAPKKQQGISFLLIDMNTPGIEVRPIITLNGEHHVNDTFFTDVRVPVENLIGEENKGWTYAKVLLTHERTGIARVGQSKQQLHLLKALAGEQLQNGRPLIEDPIFKRKIDAVEIDLMALEMTDLRVLSSVATGGAPGPESSILKIRGSEVQQAISELQMEVFGYYSAPYVPETHRTDYSGDFVGPELASTTTPNYFGLRPATVYGGSNEIQKNIISKAVFGL